MIGLLLAFMAASGTLALEGEENVRYEKIAEGLGARGEYVTRAEDFLPALRRSYRIAAKDGMTTLINCQAKKEFWTNQYPPGMPRKVEPGCMAYH